MTRLEKRRGLTLTQPPILGSGERKLNAKRNVVNSKRNHGFFHGEEKCKAPLWSINIDWTIGFRLDKKGQGERDNSCQNMVLQYLRLGE